MLTILHDTPAESDVMKKVHEQSILKDMFTVISKTTTAMVKKCNITDF